MEVEILMSIFYILLPVLLAIALLAMGFLWYRREQLLLDKLKEILLKEENDENMDLGFEETTELREIPLNPEQAIEALSVARKREFERMNMLENYRRDYIGNVAHELKTPIFAIQGYIDAVFEDPEMDRDTLELFLSKASKNSARLAQITSDLDMITKYESGFLSLHMEDFDLLNLAHEVAESMELQAKEKNISVQVVALGDHYWVHADRSRISQVLTNLVYNSIRYGKQDGHTRMRLSRTLEKIIIEVADNGIGIPQEHQSRIFERFYRVDKHRNRATGGSGLGLAICKHIVEAHGENIGLISTEGAGSVFSFSLKSVRKN